MDEEIDFLVECLRTQIKGWGYSLRLQKWVPGTVKRLSLTAEKINIHLSMTEVQEDSEVITHCNAFSLKEPKKDICLSKEEASKYAINDRVLHFWNDDKVPYQGYLMVTACDKLFHALVRFIDGVYRLKTFKHCSKERPLN